MRASSRAWRGCISSARRRWAASARSCVSSPAPDLPPAASPRPRRATAARLGRRAGSHSSPSTTDHAPARRSPGALVVGGAHVSLGLARSLGRRGIPVWLLAQHPLPRFSRYVRRCFAWPGADHPRALDVILDIAARHDLAGWVLMATGDEDMRLVARHRAELSAHLHVATPDW